MNKGLLVTLVALVSVLILISGGLLFWLISNKIDFPKQNPLSVTPTPTLAPSVNLETTVIPTQAITPSVTQLPVKSDLQQIKEAFAQKYNKPLADVDVGINDNSKPYMSGNIIFAGEISGGWFLAYYNNSNNWIIVADGNGTVMCDDIDPYNFPTSMVPECWDEANSQLITR